jgi:hypothetical protein
MPYGIAQSVWDTAKGQALELLIPRARLRGMITYSDLAKGINAVHFEPDDAVFWHMLGEIQKPKMRLVADAVCDRRSQGWRYATGAWFF